MTKHAFDFDDTSAKAVKNTRGGKKRQRREGVERLWKATQQRARKGLDWSVEREKGNG